MTTRLPDWIERFYEALEVERAKPFEYGVCDCCLFYANLELAITGVDPAAELRGYVGREGALALITPHGSLEALVTSTFGQDPVPRNLVRRGDPVIAEGLVPGEDDLWQIMGVCDGGTALFKSAHGLMPIPMDRVLMGWNRG